jgi:hypothetical protein
MTTNKHLTVNVNEFMALASIFKAAAKNDEDEDSKKETSRPSPFGQRKAKGVVHKQIDAAYPDYSKSIVTQYHKSPALAGATRAVGTGTLGAILGALIARLASNKPGAVGTGAAAGGALGAIPGFVSGRNEAESDNSKSRFLRRRMGINEPGELEFVLRRLSGAPDAIER